MPRPRIPDDILLRFSANVTGDASRAQEAPAATVERVAAYVLSLDWDRSAVTHGTLSACLPPSERQAELLAHFLRYAEARGWLTVGRAVVLVHDPKALRAYAVDGWPRTPSLRDYVNVRQALCVLDGGQAASDNGLRALQLRERNFLDSLA